MKSLIVKIKKGLNKIKYAQNILLKPLKLYLKDKSFFYSINYRYYSEKLSIEDNMILFEAAHGEKIGGNPYAIFKEMHGSKKFSNYIVIWVLNDKDSFYYDYIKKLKNVKVVKRNSKKYIKYLAQSKYLVNDTTFHFYFQKREEQIYINTWHGTPIKTLGKDVKGSYGQQKNAVRNFLHTDFIIQPNTFTTDAINYSHDLNGLYDGENIETGYPRIDLTIKADKKEIRQSLEKTIGIELNKKIILYAPTWRGELGSSESLNEDLLKNIKCIRENIDNDYILLLKVHNLSYKYISQDNELRKICIPNWFETNELLSIVDVLITDYSSIAFDFLHTKKPIIFYAYDLELYKNNRGMYIHIEDEFSNVCKTSDELIGCLKNIKRYNPLMDERYIQAIEKYAPYDDGNASKRIVDKIFINNSVDNNLIVKEANNNTKKKIALYAGSMVTNGVTTSVINLLKNVDYSKYDITLLHGGRITPEIKTNLQKLPEEVRVLFRMGTFNYRLQEYISNYLVLNYIFSSKYLKKIIPNRLYKKEFKRNFGNIKFDTVIDYCGYSPIWTLLIVNSNSKERLIYLHSEMKTDVNERTKRNNKTAVNFNIIFNLYNNFDKIISVSKDVFALNKFNFKGYATTDKFVYVPNPLDFETIINNAKEKRIINLDNEKYFLLDNKKDGKVVSFRVAPIPNSKDFNFISIGRLTNEKDPIKLVYAFQNVVNKYKNAKLYIVGNGYLKIEIENLVQKLELEDNIFIVGQLDNPHALLECCDCLILSSNYEGQGLVILEALVLGKPVIATDIPGPQGILEDKYGCLVENSIKGLGDGIINYIKERPQFEMFNYKSYNKEAMADFYKNICK